VKEINKKPSQFVSLESLILMAEHYKWKLEGDFADRNVLIPDEWGEITLENLEAALQKADIKTLAKGGN
jgi:hypothetical protein